MIHKGVRIELRIGGKTYLDIDSYIAHLKASMEEMEEGGESACRITVSRGTLVELIMRPIETNDEPAEDEESPA